MKNYKWSIRFLLLTPLLVILTIFLMGGGHGYFEPIIFLFPFASLLFVEYNELNLGFLLIALIQYPIYGILIDKLKQMSNKIITALIVIHLILALVGLAIVPEQFK